MIFRRSIIGRKSPKFRSIGEVYLGSNSMFSEDDEAAKTIGQPALGENALQIIENRRKVKGRLSDKGAEELNKVVDKVKSVFPDAQVKVTWDRYCGCSMCPCSPGYRIKIDKESSMPSKDIYRFSLFVEENKKGKTKYKFLKPKDSWVIGYDEVRKLENEFADGKEERN